MILIGERGDNLYPFVERGDNLILIVKGEIIQLTYVLQYCNIVFDKILFKGYLLDNN